QTIYNQMINLRTPASAGGNPPIPGASDSPFLSLAAGLTSAGDTQYPNGLSINNTFLRSGTNGSGTTARLFEVPGQTHPYRKYELMTKIFSNVTTRSNVFAVYCTGGFFQVMDTTTLPVKLGPEIGSATNQQVRHRMFAIVDRSVMTSNPGPQDTFDPASNPTLVPYYSIID